MFKVFNAWHQKDFYYALQHEADLLLEKGILSFRYVVGCESSVCACMCMCVCVLYYKEEHDPVNDALTSIQLFKKYYRNPQMLYKAHMPKLRSSRLPPSWPRTTTLSGKVFAWLLTVGQELRRKTTFFYNACLNLLSS